MRKKVAYFIMGVVGFVVVVRVLSPNKKPGSELPPATEEVEKKPEVKRTVTCDIILQSSQATRGKVAYLPVECIPPAIDNAHAYAITWHSQQTEAASLRAILAGTTIDGSSVSCEGTVPRPNQAERDRVLTGNIIHKLGKVAFECAD